MCVCKLHHRWQLSSIVTALPLVLPSNSSHAAIRSYHENQDYKPEADRSAGAVESAEEDLKDLKKANEQVRTQGVAFATSWKVLL